MEIVFGIGILVYVAYIYRVIYIKIIPCARMAAIALDKIKFMNDAWLLKGEVLDPKDEVFKGRLTPDNFLALMQGTVPQVERLMQNESYRVLIVDFKEKRNVFSDSYMKLFTSFVIFFIAMVMAFFFGILLEMFLDISERKMSN